MATIYKCDKCNKIIKDSQEEFYFGPRLLTHDLMKEYGLQGELTLCKACSVPLLKYLKRFLSEKKIKKTTKK